jgi:hypothetical protein
MSRIVIIAVIMKMASNRGSDGPETFHQIAEPETSKPKPKYSQIPKRPTLIRQMLFSSTCPKGILFCHPTTLCCKIFALNLHS